MAEPSFAKQKSGYVCPLLGERKQVRESVNTNQSERSATVSARPVAARVTGGKTCASGYVGKAALKTPAVQTLREVGSRGAVAKRLECDGFSIAFGRAESP